MESFFILRKISEPKKIMAENNGFNKFAFFLGPIWGIFKGLWFEGLILFWLMNFAIFIAPQFSFLFILTSSIFWGFFGKDIYIQKLLKSGYIPEVIVVSNSSQKAILIFSSKNKWMSLLSSIMVVEILSRFTMLSI